MIGDASRRKRGAGDLPAQHNAHDQPGAGKQIEVEDRRRFQSQDGTGGDHGDRARIATTAYRLPDSTNTPRPEGSEHEFENLKGEDASACSGATTNIMTTISPVNTAAADRPAVPQLIHVHFVWLHFILEAAAMEVLAGDTRHAQKSAKPHPATRTGSPSSA